MSTAPPTLSPPVFSPQATTFGKKVVFTGFVHVKTGWPLDVTVEDLTFRFTFVDSGKATANFSMKLLNPKLLELQLVDFVSPVGAGLLEPVQLGTFGGVPMYLLFTVYALTNSPVKLLFTTFLQDNVFRPLAVPSAPMIGGVPPAPIPTPPSSS
jgi:hypothetical protein